LFDSLAQLVMDLAIGGVVISAVAAASRNARRAIHRTRQFAADQLGASYDPSGWFGTPRIHGHKDGLSLEVTFVEGRNPTTFFKVRGLPENLELSQEGGLATLGKILGGQDIEIGDPEFDDEIRVQGSEAVARAALTVEGRKRVLRQVKGDGKVIKNGSASFRLHGTKMTADAIVLEVTSLLQMGKSLRLPCPVLDCVAGNAENDPLPVVRSRCFRFLRESRADLETARHAFAAGLDDAEPVVQMEAALAVLEGPQAAEALRAKALLVLRALATNTQREEGLRAAAIAAFETAASVSESMALGLALISEANPVVRVAALGVLGRRGDEHCAAALNALALDSEVLEAHEAVALAEALFRLKSSSSETVLLKLLEAKNEAVRIAAARGLGICGSVRSVEPLRSAMHAEGLLGSGSLKDTAEAAVKQIQARIAGAEAGQLSVIGEASGGEVSVAEETGTLSLTDPDRRK
jgi:hypothetical protein